MSSVWFLGEDQGVPTIKMGDVEDASDGYGRSEPEDVVKLKSGLGKHVVVRSSVRFRGEQRIVALDAISL
jgi:hypothetical protein